MPTDNSLYIKWGAGIFTGIVILLVCIIVPLSIKDVEFEDYAVAYNNLTKQLVSDTILSQGRYYYAPATILFTFKRNVQTLGPSDVYCFSSEGLRIILTLSVNYQIKEDEVIDVWREFGDQHHWFTYLESVIRSATKDVCPQFTGEQFYFSRGLIEETLRQTLLESLVAEGTHAILEEVLLTNVNHPTAYAQANEAKQEVSAEEDRVLSERDQKLTEIETLLFSARADINITLTRAQGEADAIISRAMIEADAETRKWSERTTALSVVKDAFGDISNDELITQYLRFISLGQQEGVIISVP
eukprot:TRINITY_DN11329_c0_g1_i1.p1 TRINITY_DN11329_c0_g1~~TRINITY_DN11329_c0_g1_i1.p1  ORF type:complete len:301 (+),score=80.42 TRINITY_DN11329_c0_g1_i1:65-967(+)